MANKYEPLRVFLADAAVRGEHELQLKMAEIDTLVGGLPASARKYREWWSNSGQPHSYAWREAGWRCASVDQASGMFVRFERDGAPSQRRVPAPVPSGPTQRPRVVIEVERKDWSELPPAGATDVRVALEWREAGAITLDAAERVQFPLLPSDPGVYRISLTGAPGQSRPRVYVGESDQLARRGNGYRNPGPSQTTNIRVNAVVRAHLLVGGTVRLAFATKGQVQARPSEQFVPLQFMRKAARLLAENAELVAAFLAGGVDIENIERSDAKE